MADKELENLVSSVNPANLKSFAGMMKEILRFHDIKQETVVPAQVVSYDRTTGQAKVQVLVQNAYTTQDGVEYKSGDVIELPVLRFQHGMFWVDAPLYPGDTGYVVAGHRDGSLAVEGNNRPVLAPTAKEPVRTNNAGPQPPNTYLLHRYENGFFVPCRWGTVTVEEKDSDSMIWGRLKEKVTVDQTTGKKIYSTDGTEGKVTMTQDGHVRIDNGTGLSIHSDEYRKAEEGETPDKVDADGVGWKKKPNAYIDPTADLTTSDAKFREIIAMSKETDVETGKSRFVYKKHLILADEGVNASSSELGGAGGVGSSNAYFSIYAPEDREGYSIRAGRVCVDDDQFLDVSEPEEALETTKTYYCCVKILRGSGLIAGAEIVAFDKIQEKNEEKQRAAQQKQLEDYAPEDFETCRRWIVPIGSVDEDGNITQYHVGAINLSSDALETPDFKIYVSGYDTENKCFKYSIAEGHAEANGLHATTAEEEDITLDQDYWCKVTYTPQNIGVTENLSAEIVTSQPSASSGTSIIWGVKIGKVTAEGIEQCHIGTITLCVPNRTLSVNNVEKAKFFGTSNVNIVTGGNVTLIASSDTNILFNGYAQSSGDSFTVAVYYM